MSFKKLNVSFSLALLATMVLGKPPLFMWGVQIQQPAPADQPLLTSGCANRSAGNQTVAGVKVGLLIPVRGLGAARGLAVKRGAALAVAQVNAQGGFQGHPFQLRVALDDGPWGSVSKEIVKLVFEEGVWAILGGLDGRSAHLAEQIVTKGQVVLLTPWASDPTLSQTRIPWFFRCVPDDRQQATALVREIFQIRQLQRVATVAAATYDARMATTTFAQISVAAGHPAPLQLSLGSAAGDSQKVLAQLERAAIEGVVLFGPSALMARLVQQMHRRRISPALFGPLSLADEAFLGATRPARGGMLTLVSPAYRHTPAGRDFQRAFQEAYGDPSSALAAYAYDGMKLILTAISQAGLKREKIRDVLANLDYPQGVTGPIRFDAHGNRQGAVHLMQPPYRSSKAAVSR